MENTTSNNKNTVDHLDNLSALLLTWEEVCALQSQSNSALIPVCRAAASSRTIPQNATLHRAFMLQLSDSRVAQPGTSPQPSSWSVRNDKGFQQASITQRDLVRATMYAIQNSEDESPEQARQIMAGERPLDVQHALNALNFFPKLEYLGGILVAGDVVRDYIAGKDVSHFLGG